MPPRLLSGDLFRGASPRVLDTYRQWTVAEESYKIRRHPEALWYTFLAAFGWTCQREIVDALAALRETPLGRARYLAAAGWTTRVSELRRLNM